LYVFTRIFASYQIFAAIAFIISASLSFSSLGMGRLLTLSSVYLKAAILCWKEIISKLSRVDDVPIGGKKTLAKFTYFGEEIRTLTKIFRNSMVKIAQSITNTVTETYKIFSKRVPT
jgi:hypothetical protein